MSLSSRDLFRLRFLPLDGVLEGVDDAAEDHSAEEILKRMERIVNASEQVEDSDEDEEEDDGQVEEVMLEGDVAEIVEDESYGGA